MKRGFVLFVLLAVALSVAGCGAVSNLAGGNSSTVANLWPDVPAFEGATKTDTSLPLPLRLAIQGIVKASANSSDAQLDKFEFVAYTTAKTPEDVTGFYTNEMMAARGWNETDQPGCTGAAAGGGLTGGICVFGQQSGDKGSALFIITAKDDEAGKTQIYYVRFDGIDKTNSQ